MSDIISKVKNLFSFNQTKEETEDKSNCSWRLDNEFSEDLFDEDEIKELEESKKLLKDLSKDLKTTAIENINFNSYFDKIDQEYVQSRFVKYIKDFIDNYHDESDDPFNYIENDIIFRIGLILNYFEIKNDKCLPKSDNYYISASNLEKLENYYLISCKDNIKIEITHHNYLSDDIYIYSLIIYIIKEDLIYVTMK